MLKTISRSLFSWVFPLQCQLCDKLLPVPEDSGICQSCRNNIPFISPPHCFVCARTVSHGKQCGRCLHEKMHFDRVFACVFYGDNVKKLLHLFKFRRKKFLVRLFTGYMQKFATRHFGEIPVDLVIPVPMDNKRKNERGFNQAKLFSGDLAGHLAKKHASGILRCLPPDKPQSFLLKNERKANVRGRFFVTDASKLTGRDVLLVDDILTSGQTLSACAKALKDAGARRVTAFAFARGI